MKILTFVSNSVDNNAHLVANSALMNSNSALVKSTPLREYLEARGIKQTWVASQIGISDSYFSLLMDGRRTMRRSLAMALAKLFDVPTETFLPAAAAEEGEE